MKKRIPIQNIPPSVKSRREARQLLATLEKMLPEFKGWRKRMLKIDTAAIEVRLLSDTHCGLPVDSVLVRRSLFGVDWREHTDFYRAKASSIFHVPYDQVTPEQRAAAKSRVFAELYR